MPARPPFPAALDPLQPSDPTTVGPYRVVGRLGAGGMGAVYGALDGADRCLAVKLVHREFAENDEFRARFAREVRLVERVRARCTPAFMGADAEADTPWLATEYVPGPTLRQHVNAEGPFSDGMLLALAAGLAEALHAIHSAGVVHRDLKPSNVILAPDGPKVLDFGIARALDGTGLTRTGGIMGSPGWIAPERYQGEEATPAADIFAWGGMVAFAATGRAPFGTGTPQAVAARTLNDSPDTSEVPSSIRATVEKALDRDARKRPALINVVTTLSDHSPTSLPDSAPETVAATIIGATWNDPSPTRHDPKEWLLHPPKPWRRVWPLISGLAATLASLVAMSVYLTNPSIQNEDRSTPEINNQTSTNTTPSEATSLPEHLTTEGDFTSENPGTFYQSIDGEPVLEVDMESTSIAPDGIEFTGTATYLANSGTKSFGTGHFYLPVMDPGLPDDGRWVSEPGEVFGVLSPGSPEIQFSLTITVNEEALPGALFINTDGAQTDPHLCYRREPYAETGTQFLHNAGDSWQDCAADPYE